MDESDFQGKESHAVTPEYNFENGVKAIIFRIQRLLEGQQYVVVAFHSKGQHVGKTTLVRTLMEELDKMGIPASATVDEPDEIDERHFSSILQRQKMKKTKHAVFIFEQMEMMPVDIKMYETLKAHDDRKVAKALTKLGYQGIKGVDLWVGLYRPDRPLTSSGQSGYQVTLLADIMIRNERAVDKVLPY